MRACVRAGVLTTHLSRWSKKSVVQAVSEPLPPAAGSTLRNRNGTVWVAVTLSANMASTRAGANTGASVAPMAPSTSLANRSG